MNREINDECLVLNDELENNSYFITHNSELAEGVMAENLREIQR